MILTIRLGGDGRLNSPETLTWVGRLLTLAGLLTLVFVLFELVVTGLVADQTQLDLLRTFKAGVQTTELDATSSLPAEGSAVAMLRIPSLGLAKVVVEGTTPDDLKGGPGHLRVSPLPGEFGNAVLIGRRATYGSPFGDLFKLQRGDAIALTTGQGRFSYRVTQVKTAEEADPKPLEGTLDSRLTLLTSDPALLVSRRLVVVAMLQGDPIAVPKRITPPASPAELGLAADLNWIAPGLLSLQLLAVSIWLAFRLRRRWPGSVALMLMTPVIGALTVLTFTTLDRILPGSL